MKKALIIAYHFPPVGGGGVQRTLKFVKYLKRFNWSPIVHTAANPYWSLWDQSLLSELPDDVRTYRTRTFEIERFESRLRALLVGKDVAPESSAGEFGGAPEGDEERRQRGLLSKISKTIHERLLIPDPQIGWFVPALMKTIYITKREEPDLVYTSSPPHSVQLLGLFLRQICRLPWVADFRDPWTDGVRRRRVYAKNRTRRQLEQRLERAIVSKADRIIVNTESNWDQLFHKYPFVADKLTVLTNGFDPADFQHIRTERRFLKQEHFNLTLTGNVEAMFDAIPFFQAIKELVTENVALRARLRVNFVGTRKGKYDAFIAQQQLERHVNHVGYLPHAESIQYLVESDVLFLCQIPVHESASVKLPGKLFEYLYMRKPILALTLPGVTTQLLAKSGLGVAVNPANVPGIKQAIADLFRQWHRHDSAFGAHEEFIRGFDRIRLTERLAGIFTDVLCGNTSARLRTRSVNP